MDSSYMYIDITFFFNLCLCTSTIVKYLMQGVVLVIKCNAFGT